MGMTVLGRRRSSLTGICLCGSVVFVDPCAFSFVVVASLVVVDLCSGAVNSTVFNGLDAGQSKTGMTWGLVWRVTSLSAFCSALLAVCSVSLELYVFAGD